MGTPEAQPVPNPDLSAMMDQIKDEVMLAMNCHAIALVESFDSAKLTVKTSILYPKTIDGVQKAYPVSIVCPLVVASGGGARLTFPIAKGDACLLMFNDRDIDAWFESGNARPLKTRRLHSFSDAIALVGLFSLRDVAPNAARYGAYDGTRARLSNGLTYVGVGLTSVKIANVATSLGVQMQTLLTALTAFQVATAAATTVPQIAAAAAALAAPLATVTAALGGLLE